MKKFIVVVVTVCITFESAICMHGIAENSTFSNTLCAIRFAHQPLSLEIIGALDQYYNNILHQELEDFDALFKAHINTKSLIATVYSRVRTIKNNLVSYNTQHKYEYELKYLHCLKNNLDIELKKQKCSIERSQKERCAIEPLQKKCDEQELKEWLRDLLGE